MTNKRKEGDKEEKGKKKQGKVLSLFVTNLVWQAITMASIATPMTTPRTRPVTTATRSPTTNHCVTIRVTVILKRLAEKHLQLVRPSNFKIPGWPNDPRSNT